ncbi:2592_t:CDS:2 [Paraglomus occultum]|uniref:2592_t:CDS:1 n=1 Tax=Paraglomus occultum TaxID=144539 RepID=A0A9N8WLB3_9GLOM|nr:2592_t:CDS:2 [Paraglomus occultum]
MSRVPGENEIPDIGDIYKDSLKASEEYHACLTTTIYGQKYLDPEKCKARNFDPIKEDEKQIERIHLSAKWIEKKNRRDISSRTNAISFHSPQEFVNKNRNPKSLDCLDDSPITIPKKRNKSDKKPSTKKISSLLIKASHLVNHKIKLEDGLYVKVIAAKMNKDNVFLEVEEKVGDELKYYEIEYQQDMVGL